MKHDDIIARILSICKPNRRSWCKTSSYSDTSRLVAKGATRATWEDSRVCPEKFKYWYDREFWRKVIETPRFCWICAYFMETAMKVVQLESTYRQGQFRHIPHKELASIHGKQNRSRLSSLGKTWANMMLGIIDYSDYSVSPFYECMHRHERYTKILQTSQGVITWLLLAIMALEHSNDMILKIYSSGNPPRE